MKICLQKIITIILALASLLAYAENSRDQGSRFDAHIHGVSELMVAMEGRSLEIALSSPAMNLTGFEHKAITQKDIVAVEKAASRLGKPETLFLISGGRCTLLDSSVDVSGVIDSKHKDHQPPGKSNAHREEQEHKSDQSRHDSHSEINATYHYQCDDIPELSSMTVELFDEFPGIHQIHVMWISEKQQGAVTLNTENNIMNFE